MNQSQRKISRLLASPCVPYSVVGEVEGGHGRGQGVEIFPACPQSFVEREMAAESPGTEACGRGPAVYLLQPRGVNLGAAYARLSVNDSQITQEIVSGLVNLQCCRPSRAPSLSTCPTHLLPWPPCLSLRPFPGYPLHSGIAVWTLGMFACRVDLSCEGANG